MGRILGIGRVVLGAVLLVGACSRSTAIPPGAQQVHVAITDAEVRLEPASVHAGDVYLVIDEPPEGSLTFVWHSASASATIAPLSDADIDRLERGDVQFTGASGLSAGGCDPSQRREDRGRMGPCGNVMKVVLPAGKYAVVGGSPEDRSPDGSGPPIGILEVGP
jgi:hypothetical protein